MSTGDCAALSRVRPLWLVLLGLFASSAAAEPPDAPAARAGSHAPAADDAVTPAPATPTSKASSAGPRYASVLEAELTALQLAPRCQSETPTRHVCRYMARSSVTDRGFPARAVYSDESDTVHVYVEDYLDAPVDNPGTTALLRRMMELNWEMLIGKFEWNARTGEVRLGAVMSTDSNFDRRAFRSIVKTLDTLAARRHAELLNLLVANR